jgi:hypothetical protein
MRLRWLVLGVMVAGVALAGCRRKDAGQRREAEMMVTPADAPPRERVDRGSSEGGLRPGWARYEQRKTIRLGETVRVGPTPYATVKLIEVGEGGASAAFEAAFLTDRRQGRVPVGRHFNEFTPIFGSKGARLEKVGAEGATVVFRWAQNEGLGVPPGAVRVE